MKLRFEAFLNNNNVKSITGKALDDFVIVTYKDGKEIKLYSVDFGLINPMFFKSVCDEWKYYTNLEILDKENNNEDN